MIALIVTLLAIALVSALALAALYYGGSFSNSGKARAEVSRALQEATQVSAALELYKTDNGGFPTGTSEQIKSTLVNSGYLKAWPGQPWALEEEFAVRNGMTLNVCKTLNARLGISGDPPSCADPAYAARSVCCVD